MKQRFVLFFMFLLIISSYGGGIPDGDFKKFQIGINLSPDIAYMVVKNKPGQDGSIFIRMFKETKAPKFGFTGGFNACYNFSVFFGLEAGLQYANKGYRIMHEPLNASGNKPTDPTSVSILYNLHYIDIPIKANFTVGRGKVRFIGSTGLITNIFIQERRTVWLEYTDRTEKTKYITPKNYIPHRLFLSPMVSAGINWQLNEKFSLRIEPTYRMRLPPKSSLPISTYLVNAGLNFGVYLGL